MNFYTDLIDRFRENHADISKAIENMPVEALDWTPGSEMNSINVLVVHLIGAERYWVGVAVNEAPDRDREDEFRAKGLSADKLMKELVSADEYVSLALAHLSLDDLEGFRLSPRNAKSFTVGFCLAHALEHTALHTGHIQLTRQLWELKGKL